MNAGRFKKIIDFVKEIPEEHFDMSEILQNIKNHPWSDLENHCGSVGCVVGWLPKIFPNHYEYISYGGNWIVCSINSGGAFSSLEHFLDINELQTQQMFDSSPYMHFGVARLRTKQEQIDAMETFYEAFKDT